MITCHVGLWYIAHQNRCKIKDMARWATKNFILCIYSSENCSQLSVNEEKQRSSKVRRRTTQPQELLYGVNTASESLKVDEQNQNHYHPLTRVPSAPGSLRYDNFPLFGLFCFFFF